ncbi:MAG: immunoglobulin domain-containing protein [Burkholderiaceae bacterium]
MTLAAALPLALALMAVPLAARAGSDEKSVEAAAAQKAMPVIAAQPLTTVVYAGRPVTFKVLVTSPTPLSYQWSRNGQPIVGGTANNHVIPATALDDNGASFTVSVKNAAGTAVSSVARLTVNAIMPQIATADRPFSDQSPWNARPTEYTLGPFEVPRSTYLPTVAEGIWSTGAFVASASDPSVTVVGPADGSPLWVPDAEANVAQMVIPHWPANVVPAAAGDGHADIIDPSTNRIHSFYQLRLVDGQWHAAQYTWTALDGRGFGTPGQYQQGARAAGVPPSAGLIRTKEIDDGLPAYRHALAMSMTFTALARSPAYTFPATNADGDAATTNSGSIPEGALMLLPANFDLSAIRDPRLLKIARTLQSFGAYVVDRNTGTPYDIYVENGSNFDLMPNGPDDEIAAELDLIRAGLRQVVSATEWIDASGAVFIPEHRLNLLSMRGYWYVTQGDAPGVFDTQTQSVVFPSNGIQTAQVNAS